DDFALAVTPVHVVDAAEGAEAEFDLDGFHDANPYSTPADFGLTIDWDDDTPPAEEGSLTEQDDVFDLVASHDYSTANTYEVSVVASEDDGQEVTWDRPVEVAPSIVDVQPRHLEGGQQEELGGVVATFSDPAGPRDAGDYEASVWWGDGTDPDP